MQAWREREERGLRQDADNRQPVEAQRFTDIDAQIDTLATQAEDLRALAGAAQRGRGDCARRAAPSARRGATWPSTPAGTPCRRR